MRRLKQLPGNSKIFHGSFRGDFPEREAQQNQNWSSRKGHASCVLRMIKTDVL